MTRTQNICLLAGAMSSAVEAKFPVNDSSIATQNTSDNTASRGPARSSFPQGAGKCPIAKLKLRLCPPSVRTYSRYADMSPTTAIIAHESFSGIRPCFGSNGVTIAAIIMRNMLANGILYANMFITLTLPLPPRQFWLRFLPAPASS